MILTSIPSKPDAALKSKPTGNANVAETETANPTETVDLDVPENEVLYTIKDRVATVMLNAAEQRSRPKDDAVKREIDRSLPGPVRRAGTH